MKGKILVTGGTGFIGSHTTVELQQAGYEVVIIDNLSNSNVEVLDGIERITGIRPVFVEGDCTDRAVVRKLFEDNPGISGIINFAASKAVGESIEKPIMYYRNNINILLNLLELMPEFGVKGFVFSSSCTVYGEPDKNPITEDAPTKKATSPYGATKQIATAPASATLSTSLTWPRLTLRPLSVCLKTRATRHSRFSTSVPVTVLRCSNCSTPLSVLRA